MTATRFATERSEAIVIVKAAPQIGAKSGEIVCCAGVDANKNWVRLFPVSFRQLDKQRKFNRWDKISYSWRKPKDDKRIESRRVDHESIEIVGSLPRKEHSKFLSSLIVTSVDKEYSEGRTLALLKPEIIDFFYIKKSEEDIREEVTRFEIAQQQQDLFAENTIKRYQACPYTFKYRYLTSDGLREGTCQDWEIPTTYLKWSKLYGEAETLEKMVHIFGKDYPRKGLVFAMGTHSQYPGTWLINGVIRLDSQDQLDLL